MANDAVFETREIKMGASDFLREFIFRYVWIWILGLSAVGVAGLVLGVTIDLRWLVVGLAFVLIVCPMVFAFLYYYYGLRRECFVNTVSHRLLIGQHGITARLIVSVPEENPSPSDLEEQTVSCQRTRDEYFPYSALTSFRVGSKSAIVPFRKPVKGFIWIPAGAFDDDGQLAAALEYIDNRTNENTEGF